MHASKKRSLVKSLTWRALASFTTLTIAWFLTGSFSVSASIAGIEVVAKMIIYYLHERGWSKVKWGYENVKN